MSFGTKLGPIFLFLIFSFSNAGAEWVGVDSAIEPENDYSFHIISADNQKVELEFSLAGFNLENIRLEEKDFIKLILRRAGDLGGTGLPELPALSRTIAMPNQGGARLEVNEVEYWEADEIMLAPLQPPKLENGQDDPAFVWDQDYYLKDEFYPEQRVRIGKPVIMRDLRLLPIDFFLVSYNPVTRTIRAVKRMKLTVYFEGAGENSKMRDFTRPSVSFKPLYDSMVLNYDYIDIDDDPPHKGGYLIISSSQLCPMLEPFIEWKRQKGHPVVWSDIASIGNTYSNIYNHIYSAYYTWEEPPEFVLLVGDVDGLYPIAAEYYNGGMQNDITDHKYSMLEGVDYFPDVQVGRISIANSPQLRVIVNKIINYEGQPYMTHPEWFKKALMIACTSHISCKHTKQWIRETLLEYGFTEVETVWYSVSLSTTTVTNILNEGVGYLNYRGYDNWGGWNNSCTNALDNYWKLFMVTGMVCNTSDFAESECRAECFLRTGNVNPPTGAVTTCGPSSLYTHTKWNNCIDVGFYAGLFDQNITTASGALNAGKMELWLNFPNNRGPGTTSNSVECYFHEYNIIGDPGLELWTDEPVMMDAISEDELAVGANNLPVTVTYSGTGEPVAEAYACLYMDGEIIDRAYTDSDGYVSLIPLPSDTGQLYLTITKHDHYPIKDTIQVFQPSVFFSYIEAIVDDDSTGASAGNGDGIPSPGETIELQIRITNTGVDTAFGVSACLSLDDVYITMLDSEEDYGQLAPGDTAFCSDAFDFSINEYCPDGYALEFTLTMFDEAGDTSISMFEIPIEGVSLMVDSILVEPAGAAFEPGDTLDIVVYLYNQGAVPSGDIQLTISNSHPWFEILEGEANIGSIPIQDTLSNYEQPFKVITASEMTPGIKVDFYLALQSQWGYSESFPFSVKVGVGGLVHPVGPDEYGYFAFGIEDAGYEQCPQYDWINIGGVGTILNLNEGSEHGDAETITLPFTFRYYGQDFDQLTVSSNGWTGLIPTDLVYFYNFAIPTTLGPSAMIAPFWDDLSIGDARIGYHYLSEDGIFVVTWGNTYVYSQSSSTNTFQLILYDPAVHPTPTGDGMIKFQYQDFHNTHSDQNYSTIGIESPDGQDGIEYTFASIYADNAGALSAGKAVLFTTLLENDNSPPQIFCFLPSDLDTVEIDTSVMFKADAVDPDGDLLSYNWFHREQLVSETSACGVTFDQAGSDTITVVVSDGLEQTAYECIIFVQSFGIADETPPLPIEYSLGPLTPNPFNPALNIDYSVAHNGQVKISVYNILGREVARLVDGSKQSGQYRVTWESVKTASGIYLVRMEASGFVEVKKAVLLK